MTKKLQAKAKRTLKKAKPTSKTKNRVAKMSQKSPAVREKKNFGASSTSKSSLFTTTKKDPAHMPGHQKMNLKEQLKRPAGPKVQNKNLSAMNNMARTDRFNRTSNRRVITGATLGKTGRITIKD